MTDLRHLFRKGQFVKCSLDGERFRGIVETVSENYILVNIPGISDHCRFEPGVNLDCVFPEYN